MLEQAIFISVIESELCVICESGSVVVCGKYIKGHLCSYSHIRE